VKVFWLQGGDITVRNNVVDLRGLGTDSKAPDALVALTPNMAGSQNGDRVQVLNNTVYSDATSTKSFLLCAGAVGGVGHLCRNNLVFLPGYRSAAAAADEHRWGAAQNVFATRTPFAAPLPAPGRVRLSDFRLARDGEGSRRGHAPDAEESASVLLDASHACRAAGSPPDAGAHQIDGYDCLGASAGRSTKPVADAPPAPGH
jgi:hypothetical protein